MRFLFILFYLFFSLTAQAQLATEIVGASYNKFKKLSSYSSNVGFQFDIPGVNIKNLNGKVYYKAPDKYRVKLEGIAFVPNENPMKVYTYLSDPSKYNALLNSSENVRGIPCHVIHIIPIGEADFILGKLWIGKKDFCPYKIEMTARRGTIKMENFYKTMVDYGLPDKVIFYLEDFKAPKEKGLGPKKEKTDKKTATITMLYSLYAINIPIADSLFPKKIATKVSNK